MSIGPSSYGPGFEFRDGRRGGLIWSDLTREIADEVAAVEAARLAAVAESEVEPEEPAKRSWLRRALDGIVEDGAA